MQGICRDCACRGLQKRIILQHLAVLLQAANHPHADLASHEVESSCRMSEHLMYLVQHGRGTLGTLGSCYDQLSRLLGLLGALAGATAEAGVAEIPPQVR